MQFGGLNLTGFIIVTLMMIPNLIYARRNPHVENKCIFKPMLILDQTGRYGAMAMMIFPFFRGELGFRSPEELVIWLFLLPALLLAKAQPGEARQEHSCRGRCFALLTDFPGYASLVLLLFSFLNVHPLPILSRSGTVKAPMQL